MKESRYSVLITVSNQPVSIVVAARGEDEARQMIKEQFEGKDKDKVKVKAVWRHDPKPAGILAFLCRP